MHTSEAIGRLELVQRELDSGRIRQASDLVRLLIVDLETNAHKRSWIFCTNCGSSARHMGKGLCPPCYQYLWRTGRPRPDFARVRLCRGCRKNRKHHGHGYCSACYNRRRRAGKLMEVTR